MAFGSLSCKIRTGYEWGADELQMHGRVIWLFGVA